MFLRLVCYHIVMRKKEKEVVGKTSELPVKEKKITVKRRSFLDSIFHILFNIVVAVASLVLLLIFPEAPWAAFLVVIASKFRIFAVKPRFWLANILASLPDLIFCLGIVVLTWLAGENGALWLQIILTAIYIVWLLLIKPMTKQSAVTFQALLSQFIGISALFAVADYLTLPVTVLLSFGIGFASARHILLSHQDNQLTLASVVWGLIVAELSFLAYHWSVVYEFFEVIRISQFALLIVALSIIVERVYDNLRKNKGKIKISEVLWPVAFSLAFILILVIVFN